MHISLNLVAIVVIFTEHVLTIVFFPVSLFISQETEGLYVIIRKNNKLKLNIKTNAIDVCHRMG